MGGQRFLGGAGDDAGVAAAVGSAAAVLLLVE